MRPHRGEAGPSGAKHRHVKNNKTKTITKDNSHNPSSQGQPPNHRPHPHHTTNLTTIKPIALLSTLPFLVPFNVSVVFPTENVPSSPSFVETLDESFHRKPTDLNQFHYLVPGCFGVDNELVPNTVLNLGLMSLFVVKHLIIMFNSDGSKGNASKEMPNFNQLAVFFGDPFTKQSLLPVEAIIIAHPNPTKFMHNVRGPSPSYPGLNTIPNFMFNRFACIKHVKHALFED